MTEARRLRALRVRRRPALRSRCLTSAPTSPTRRSSTPRTSGRARRVRALAGGLRTVEPGNQHRPGTPSRRCGARRITVRYEERRWGPHGTTHRTALALPLTRKDAYSNLLRVRGDLAYGALLRMARAAIPASSHLSVLPAVVGLVGRVHLPRGDLHGRSSDSDS